MSDTFKQVSFLERFVGSLLPDRPAMKMADWPEGLCDSNGAITREIMERYWPIDGWEGFHDLKSVDDGLRDFRDWGADLLGIYKLFPLASGPNGDCFCIALDGTTSMWVANHESVYGLDEKGIREAKEGGAKDTDFAMEMDCDLESYLDSLLRMENYTRSAGQYDLDAPYALAADYWEVRKWKENGRNFDRNLM